MSGRNSFLLDTNILIWLLTDDDKLSRAVALILRKPENKLYFSQVSLIEIAIKKSLNRLEEVEGTIMDIYQQLEGDYLTYLPIENQHIAYFSTLRFPDNHRDPFDRLLISTAAVHGYTSLSADAKFDLHSDVVAVVR